MQSACFISSVAKSVPKCPHVLFLIFLFKSKNWFVSCECLNYKCKNCPIREMHRLTEGDFELCMQFRVRISNRHFFYLIGVGATVCLGHTTEGRRKLFGQIVD